MKKNSYKLIPCLAALLVGLTALLAPVRTTYCAPTGSAGFSGSDVTLDIGATYTISWSISASENVLLEATFAVSSGLTVVENIQCAQSGNTSTSKVLDYSGSYSSFNGTIKVRADAAGQHTVRMTEVVLRSESSAEATTVTSGAFTVYVRTKEQTDASIAAQESIRRQQEEEASRRQSEEASRAASISASASEEERRRRESEDASYREWARQSSIEASIAASEAARAASISASESAVAASISESEAEVAASISASESEVERTRPTEVGKLGFVRYAYGKDEDEDGEGDQAFYFAVDESEVKWPEGATPISMRINDVNVLALRMDGMASNTYLVYGMREQNEAPAWEYWHRSTNEFFRFDYLNANTSYREPATESTTTARPSEKVTTGNTEEVKQTTTAAPKSTEAPTGATLPVNPSGKKLNIRDMILLVLCGAVGGAAVTALIFVLVSKGKKKDDEAGASGNEAHSAEAAAPVAHEPEMPKEKTGDTDAVDLD